MAAEPILYGAPYSVYVRTVRLTLEEKGIHYNLVPIDIFAERGPPADYLLRHPFGRIPAFEYLGFRLYEAGAIIRYIDENFAAPALQPSSPAGRARVSQILSILDSYLYRPLVWDIYIERVEAPKQGRPTDEARIQAALPKAAVGLSALEQIMGAEPFFAGPNLTLADIHAASMFAYFVLAPEAQVLLADHPLLRIWWARVAARPSMKATAYP